MHSKRTLSLCVNLPVDLIGDHKDPLWNLFSLYRCYLVSWNQILFS